MNTPRGSWLRGGSWLLGIAVVGGIALAGATSAPAAAQVFNPKTFTLANGLQVVVISSHRTPIVSHMVWYRVGSADEVAGKSGIAHFLEHLMFKGTRSFRPGEFSKIVAREGGRDNAFTGHDYTGYFQNVAKDRLEIVMRLEADRMQNLVLTDAEVDPERDVVLEERRSAIDNRPASRLREQAQATMFTNHPYGRPIIGWAHEIRALTTADAVAWYRTYYTPNNAVLIVSGDVTVEEVRPLAEKYSGAVPARPVPPRVRPQEPPPQAARRVVLKDAQVRQPAWSRDYPAPSHRAGEREHAYPLQVLAQVLTGSAASRLYKAIVLDQKLATAIDASYWPVALDQTSFNISASPREGVELDRLEAAIEAELARFLTEGAAPDEVERAKQRLQAQAIYARDSLQGGARAIGAALMTGGTIDDVEEWPQRIAAITPEQVTAAARHVLHEERSVTALLLPKPSS